MAPADDCKLVQKAITNVNGNGQSHRPVGKRVKRPLKTSLPKSTTEVDLNLQGCQENSFVPHETDCRKYYRCIHGRLAEEM